MAHTAVATAFTPRPAKSSTPWRPILQGVAAARAREAIEAIAADILSQPPAGESADSTQQPYLSWDNLTLAGGDAGLALFYSYLSQSGFGKEHRASAIALLTRSVEGLAGEWMLPWLHQGFTGIAWAVEHLGPRLFDPDDEDSNEFIDDVLKTRLDQPFQSNEFELLTGLSGLGVYALERLPRPSARRLLHRIVDRLDELAVKSGDGITWLSSAAQFPITLEGSSWSGPYHNFGLAHGIPGAISFLGSAYAAGIARRKIEVLLEGAMRWFLRQELPATSTSRFPTRVIEGHDPGGSRLAWCYGDAGIAAALMSAALHTGNRRWEAKSVEIALAAAARSIESAAAVDAGLCHGAAGLAHIFNRLHAATGQEALAEASRKWFSQTLDMRRPGAGVGGYLSWEPVEEERWDWVGKCGFLSGSSGIALALLGAITDVEPQWDRVLMTNLPVKEWR